MKKYVLWAGGIHHWSTASEDRMVATRMALRHFGIPDSEIMKNDLIVGDRWFRYIQGRHDGATIVQAEPVRGIGKTEPERKLIGYRMGKHDKVYPPHIFTPVYEEPPSTYVTRESAERAISAAFSRYDDFNGGRGEEDFIALLQDKPKERVKAGRE